MATKKRTRAAAGRKTRRPAGGAARRGGGRGAAVRRAARPMSPATLAVHAGDKLDPVSGLFHTPIVQSATFGFRNTRDLVATYAGKRPGGAYTRWSNPSFEAAERKIAALEGADACLLFSSGMAAITSAILSLVREGDHVVSTRGIYGGAYEFFSGMLPRLGASVTFVDGTDLDQVRWAFKPGTRLLYAESPVNPTLTVLDIRALARVASDRGVPFLLDGTFASPINQRPLGMGVSVVLHSATKYLGGHSDIVAGAAAGPRGLMRKVYTVRKLLGGIPDPHQAWLLSRSMRTLEVRVRRQNEVALAVARRLERHPQVLRVLYPGLRSHPQHALARRQMSGFGGMMTFEVRGGLRAATRVADRLKLIRLAASLGGVESLCCHPALTSHLHVPPEERRRAGIRDGMIRLSCGIEDPADLIADLEQALGR
ncbi:MAG: aminotransferase class I/II-fold pyridoxal phosphate-dependent enzyme [Candidatus Eisenbacteria bacterium]|nr:aminotransferase class I/II-fold pyridoxal phosphate-dependent enzyme [Candidatus Eisenbacteria bacterium]